MENKELQAVENKELSEKINFSGVELTMGDIFERFCVHIDGYGNKHRANKREFAEFKYMMQTYNLDPNLREISMMPFYSYKLKKYEFNVIVGVNGFVKHAHKMKVTWDYEDNFKDDKLISTKILVYLPGYDRPITEIVYMDEYNPNMRPNRKPDDKDNPMWLRMEKGLLHKCGLVAGLRKAGVLVGVYIREEMEYDKQYEKNDKNGYNNDINIDSNKQEKKVKRSRTVKKNDDVSNKEIDNKDKVQNNNDNQLKMPIGTNDNDYEDKEYTELLEKTKVAGQILIEEYSFKTNDIKKEINTVTGKDKLKDCTLQELEKMQNVFINMGDSKKDILRNEIISICEQKEYDDKEIQILIKETLQKDIDKLDHKDIIYIDLNKIMEVLNSLN